MIPVSQRMLLSDDPEFWDRVVHGQEHQYMAADSRHPATEWVVLVDGYYWLTVKADLAQLLFKAAKIAFSKP